MLLTNGIDPNSIRGAACRVFRARAGFFRSCQLRLNRGQPRCQNSLQPKPVPSRSMLLPSSGRTQREWRNSKSGLRTVPNARTGSNPQRVNDLPRVPPWLRFLRRASKVHPPGTQSYIQYRQFSRNIQALTAPPGPAPRIPVTFFDS
jgi:hypothetical protein